MADVHTCDECGKRLATIGGLEIHKALAHGGDFPDPSVLQTVDDRPAVTTAEPLDVAISPPMMKAPEVRGARPPRSPLFGGIDPAEPLAWVLTVLLFLGGVVAVIHRPHPPSDVTGVLASNSTASSADPGRRAADEELLRTVQIEPQDLSTGWTMTSNEVQPDPAAPDGCMTQPAWDDVIAGRSREFAYQLLPSGRESGHVYDVVSTSPTPAKARARLDLTRSDRYASCWIKSYEQSVHDAGPDVVIGTPSFEPLDVSLPAEGTAFRSVVHMHAQGNPIILTIDNYHLAVGRVLAHIEFQRCSCEDAGTLSGPALELPVLSAVARRLASVSGR